MQNNEDITFEAFKEQWLMDVRTGNPTTVELGRRFAWKIVTQHFELDESSDDEDLHYCDGSRDGGIDIAYLERSDAPNENEADENSGGHKWYLVQSKYGKAFQGTTTLLEEGLKVLDTLEDSSKPLSSVSQDVLTSLRAFREHASEQDRIILVFATEDPLTDPSLKKAVANVQLLGQARLGSIFEVESISVENIYRKAIEDESVSVALTLQIKGNLSQQGGGDLLAGTIPLLELYDFLKAYRTKTGDLDQLYEKNVRRFLGTRGRVNRAMQATLQNTPELFGLYNNGITIVVKNFEVQENSYTLTEPYVVNGCQTTRSIYETFRPRLEAGGTGTTAASSATDQWKMKATQGVVIAKIVKVGVAGEDQLRAITRYTNSQNAIRDKDFMALDTQLRQWAEAMENEHGVFLEIQKGSWEARKALQKRKPSVKQFLESDYANAFDLLKVYGAGWLCEAGAAWQQNKAFLPGGTIFHRIVTPGEGEESFGSDDLFAAFQLHKRASGYKFGRSATQDSRKLTRFLFYFVVIELLKSLTIQAGVGCSRKVLTHALLNLSHASNQHLLKMLLDMSISVIDRYLNQSVEDSLFTESTYTGNVNTFLKSDQLGKSSSYARNLHHHIQVTHASMSIPLLNQPASIAAMIMPVLQPPQ